MAISIEYAKYLEGRRAWEKAEENRAKIFADSRWAWRYEQAQTRARYERLAEPLARSFDRALSGLEKALGNFTWPENGLPFEFRRSVSADSKLDGKLSAEAIKAENADRYYKFFSRGRDASSDSGLTTGDYRFDISLGGKTESIELDVSSTDTWGDVLDNVAEAVNEAELPVQAEVVVQHNPYQKVDGLGKTGSILSFTVEPGRDEQDLEIKDTKGLLIHKLDLEETETPVLPAGVREYGLKGTSRADPSAYYSKGVDPNASSGVSAGEYKLAYSIGGESGTFDINVESGTTWEELLNKTAKVINSTSDKVQAGLVDTEIFSGLEDPLRMGGKALEIKAKDPKIGERLSLSEYGGPWLDSVNEFFDPVGNTPADPITGDRYVALSTANGWTKGNVYEWNGSAWAETAPVSGNALYATEESADYFYDGSNWSTTPAGGFMDSLDLKNPNPGADARLYVDGEGRSSATGTFSKDKGRLVMELEDSFGERLPLKVVESMDKLSEGFSEVVGSFNELQEFLEPNKDLFREDFLEDWREPVRDMRSDLSWLGVDEMGGAGILMADSDKFWRAVGTDPERAQRILTDAQDGLFTAWSELAAKARSPDIADSIIPNAYLQGVSAPASKVFDNEKRSDLQKLIDSKLSKDSPNRTTEMEMEILKAVSDAATDTLFGEADLDLPGGVFKTKG